MRRRGAGFWWSAFAIGAAVGGIAGLLLAPRRGSELRATLFETMGAPGASEQFRRRVDEVLASGRTSPSALIGQAQRQLEDLRSQAATRIGDVRLRGQILQKQAELRYLQGKERMRRFM